MSMRQNNPYEDESLLLRSFRTGDSDAFRAIYDMHYRPLYHFANQYVKDPEQAEDIIAESFIVLWQKRADFQTLKGLVAFLYTVIRNASLNHLRKIRRRVDSNKELTYLFESRELFQHTEAIKTDLIHLSLIEGSRLPSEMKKVFQLLYMEGFSTSEIADKLSLSVKTVRAQKGNAIRRIRESLTKKGLLSWFL
jgi:RNA polymerase sigma-70 factor (family 1)